MAGAPVAAKSIITPTGIMGTMLNFFTGFGSGFLVGCIVWTTCFVVSLKYMARKR